MERQQRIRKTRRVRRLQRVRRRVRGTPDRPRLSVSRSHKQIYVQAIDDLNGLTLAASSSLVLAPAALEGRKKLEIAHDVGKDVARRLTESGVQRAVFDRGWYRFHGRVKALASGAREGGLDF